MSGSALTNGTRERTNDSVAGALLFAESEAAPFAHYFLDYFGQLEDLTDYVEVELELDDEDDLGADPWGEHTPLIEDWFAAGEDLEDAEDWGPRIADGWTDGMVMTRPTIASGAGRASTVLKG